MCVYICVYIYTYTYLFMCVFMYIGLTRVCVYFFMYLCL